MHRILVAAWVTLSLATCAGCGRAEDTAQDPGPADSTVTSATATPIPSASSPGDALSDPPLTGKPDASTTVTGTVSPGVEAGCLLLETGAETLQLIGGPPDRLTAGARVQVSGVRDPSVSSTCQQGTPFRVRDVRQVG